MDGCNDRSYLHPNAYPSTSAIHAQTSVVQTQTANAEPGPSRTRYDMNRAIGNEGADVPDVPPVPEHTYDIQVPATMPPIPVVRPNLVTIPAVDNGNQHFNGVAYVDIPSFVPQERVGRARLVQSFRDEILEDLVHDILLENGVAQYHITGHDLHQAQVEEAIANHGRVSGKPYLLSTNIYRHDWHPSTGNCTYSLNIKTGPPRGVAEYLEEHYAGVRFALWRYWGERKGIRLHHVHRYVNDFGPHGYFQAIM